MIPRGFSVRIFVPTGDPEGLKIVEKSNWVGLGLVFPRAQYPEVRKRSELKRPGIYILWGPDEETQLTKVYIGEGDEVLSRLDQHAKQKDFWTHAAVFTSKDDNLNKAYIRYMESRLIAQAKAAGIAKLDNYTEPPLPPLSEADAADAEAFLHEILLLFPVVGVTFFERRKPHDIKSKEFYLKGKGVKAKGLYTSEGFIVLKGSQAVKDETPSIHPYMKTLRDTLIKEGILQDEGDTYRFTKDYPFTSPSTAAGVVLGRAANGRIEWKDSKGRTLKEIQEAEIA